MRTLEIRRWTSPRVMLIWLCLSCGLGSAMGQGQSGPGTIEGEVIDSWFRTGLPGVIVTVRGTTLATTTDDRGQFRLANVPAGDHIVVFSKGGYTRSVVTEVAVAAGQVTRVDNHLTPVFYEMEEYVVTAAELQREMTNLLADQQNSLSFKNSLGKDYFSRAGAGDAGEAAAKIVGVTIQDGKFLVVRGLAERYNNTLLNGARVPSADPDKKAVQLDIFPTDAIDRIETSKTFTPDLPGDFAGGSVNIVTRRFPTNFVGKVTLGTGYNDQSTFDDRFLTYNGGSTDWLGFDDGTRDIPSVWAEHDPGRADTLQNATRRGPVTDRVAAADELLSITRTFDEQMTSHTEAPGPDMSLAGTLGDQIKVFDKKFGYLAGLNYDRKSRFYGSGQRNRYNAQGTDTLLGIELYEESRGVEQVSWAGLVNLSYELHPDHELALNFLYNRTSDNEAVRQSGFDFGFPDKTFEAWILHWTERELQTYQILGSHDFPWAVDMHTDWVAAYSRTSQEEPDYRILEYVMDVNGRPDIPLSGVLEPTRFWRELDEVNVNLKLDHYIPFVQWTETEGKFKLGGFYSTTERNYKDRRFAYNSNSSPRYAHFASSGDPAMFAGRTALDYAPSTFGAYKFNAYISEKPFNQYTGTQDVVAGYGMAELPLTRDIKLVGGARVESSEITLRATGEFPGESSIPETDVLPAASLIYQVITNMNVRIAYGKTLARPAFREIGPPQFDFVNREILVGNPELEQTSIANYDLRWEWFRRPGELLSASVFYKTLSKPIEKTILTQNGQVQYQNRREATLYGFELETRTSLDIIDDHLDFLSAGANFTWVESEVNASRLEYDQAIRGIDKRQLQGQSPYIINADLTFSNPNLGTTASVFYNIFGERLSEVSNISPNLFEQPVHTVDFTLSQRLNKFMSVKFSAKNLLNPNVRKTIDFQGTEFVATSRTRGRSYSISLSMEW